MNDTGPPPERPDKTPPAARKNPGSVLQNMVGFSTYACLRFVLNGGQQRAAALTFTTLLAIVPLLAVSFAIFSAFPAFERLEDKVMDLIFSYIPSVGDEVRGYLEGFTAQTGSLTAVGIVFLALSAVMLLMSISSTFNKIWQVRQTRGLISRLLVFWAVLTLTPMLFGASISLSSYLFAAARASGVESVTGSLTNFAFVLPFLLQTAGLTILYLVMPNYPVARRDALIGGLVAGILLDVLKRGFGLYVTYFPTYETIYGAMATIPIFLIWCYVSWMVVLLGAEMAAALPEWRHGSRTPRRGELPILHRLSSALAVLNALHRAAQDGRPLSERQLSRIARIGPQALGWTTRKLEKLNYIARTERSRWVLSRDLSSVPLSQLYSELGLDLSGPYPTGHRSAGWAKRFAETVDEMGDARDRIMATDLRTLLSPTDDVDEPMDDPEEEPVAPNMTFRTKVLALIGLGTLGQAG